MNPQDVDLAVTGYRVALREGVWRTHPAFGVLLLLLAERVRSIRVHAPQMPETLAAECDFALDDPRIRVFPWPVRVNSIGALRHPLRLLRQYRALVASGDVVFLRGGGPMIWSCHWMARRVGKPVIHWLISNPLAALPAAQRGYGRLVEFAGRVYTRVDAAMLRLGLRISRAEVIANGREVAALYRCPRAKVIVSSTIRASDFHDRADTCTGPGVRLLFVGYVRPEKGIEHLLRAIPLVRAAAPVDLAVVGSWEEFPAEKDRLTLLAGSLGIESRVTWLGHQAFGPALFSEMDASDVLVLPSLSEGTPRVLVEARARSLPVVATRVGGVPDSVVDSVDGLLVPPRDPVALAQGIQRLIEDGELRRRLIREGRRRVQGWTVDAFVEDIVGLIRGMPANLPPSR
ncbi:MAG: glycosyltransferase family 4 protein [Phycisphaerae bacterium]|nr:glycosyltransferase family 4 protein [Planctomycetia bacterium]MCK6466282.1 glycosyltransferase family 4 protein [Phycisphaerae bacterium]MCL4717315.1 glycosyltransferase family 4 protein [Phycisphaerae bacterium]NUQ07879.1 glycosyltransferase family 4 protein [Phycisphaerae bacterium]